MNEVSCPACSGPDNAQCVTCNGTSFVTQEVYDLFVAARDKRLATWKLQRALSELPIENIPGVEQTAIVVTTAENTITADVDGTNLTWDESTSSWV